MTLETISVSGQPFASALRARVAAKPKNYWDAQIGLSTTAPVKKGDALLATFFVRGTQIVTPPAPADRAWLTFVFEENSGKHVRSASQNVTVGEDWTKVQIPIAPRADYAAGAVFVGLQMSHQAQQVEIADPRVENFGTARKLSDLPRSGTGEAGAGNGGGAKKKLASLSGGVSLLAPGAVLPAALPGAALQTSRVPVTDQPTFTQAIRAVVPALTEPADKAALFVPAVGPVAAGDALVATFFVRGTPTINPITGLPRVKVAFGAGKPVLLEISQDRRMALYREKNGWQYFQMPFTAPEAVAPGQGRLLFHLGQVAQTVEIGGVRLTNYGKTVAASEIEALPQRPRKPVFFLPAYSEADRRPDAPWRTAAHERIDRLRKGDLIVVVRDARGRPVPGATVRARLAKHAFGFGTVVDAPLLLGERKGATPADVQKYNEIARTWFSRVSFENDLKWNRWAGSRERALRAVKYLENNHLGPIRGHVLLWGNFSFFPKTEEVEHAKSNPPALQKIALDHVADQAGALKGRIHEWDVMNEPYTNWQVQEIVGDQAMVEWFRAARKANPGAKLYVNDFDNIEGNDAAHADHYERLIQYLVDNKAPLDGIGLQSHYFNTPRSPQATYAQLDRFARFGLPLQITEFDVPVNVSSDLRADYTRDLVTLFLSHPAVNLIQFWGYWEKAHWYPQAALFNADWSVRANGKAWDDLFHRTLTTNATGVTGADGRYKTRGFFGDYEVSVRRNNKTKTLTAPLAPSRKPLVIVLD